MRLRTFTLKLCASCVSCGPPNLASELRNLLNFDVGGATIGPAPRSNLFRTCDIFARSTLSSSFYFPFFLFLFLLSLTFLFLLSVFFLFVCFFPFFFFSKSDSSIAFNFFFFFSLFSFDCDQRQINISFSSLVVYSFTYLVNTLMYAFRSI